MGINVTKTDTGWTITKDGVAYSVTDKNNNGKIDSEDLCKALSGSGNALSADDLTEASFKAMELNEEGMSASDMARYEQWQKQQEAKAKQQEQVEQYQKALQQLQQPPKITKKQKFWNNFGMISSLVLGGASAVMGGISGFFGGSNGWAFENTTNDWALRMNSGLTGTLFGLSSGLSMMAPSLLGTSGLTGGNISTQLSQIMLQSQNEMSQNQIFAEQLMQNLATERSEAQTQQEKAAVANGIKAMYESGSKEGDKVISKSNLDALDKIYEPGKEEYSEEEIKTATKIKTYPHIPIALIAEDGEECATKLTPVLAKELNAVLGSYKKETNESKQQDILTPENYRKLIEFMAKSELTEADVSEIKNILKNPVQREDS